MTGHKASIFATIFVGILGAGVALYTHYDGKGNEASDIAGVTSQKQSQEDKDKSTNENTPRPSINIAEVFVTPIDTEQPSTFYSEVSNTGTASATGFALTIDFGESSPSECEFISDKGASKVELLSGSIQKFGVPILDSKSSVYIVCSLNLPYFKSINVSGGNISIEKTLTYEKYKEERNGGQISFYEGLLRTLLVGLLALFLFGVFRFVAD